MRNFLGHLLFALVVGAIVGATSGTVYFLLISWELGGIFAVIGAILLILCVGFVGFFLGNDSLVLDKLTKWVEGNNVTDPNAVNKEVNSSNVSRQKSEESKHK